MTNYSESYIEDLTVDLTLKHFVNSKKDFKGLMSKIFKIMLQGWRMVLQKVWVSQNFSRISRVSQSRFFSGYVRLAVSYFIRRSLGVSFFCKTKGLEVPIRLFVLKCHTSPKLSELHKKLENLPQRHLTPEKKQLFCSRAQ